MQHRRITQAQGQVETLLTAALVAVIGALVVVGMGAVTRLVWEVGWIGWHYMGRILGI